MKQIKEFKITRVHATGINPPHTIELESGRKISIVYFDTKYIPQDMQYSADAVTYRGETYKLYTSADGERALAVKAK